MGPKKTINFSPGPAKLPEEVMAKAQKSFVDYEGTGIGVMEMSHRGAVFSKIIATIEADLRELLNMPDNYKIIFLQGGGTGQFAGVPMNLINHKPGKMADYIVTGTWSSKAAKEAEKYGTVNMVLPKTSKYSGIPDPSTWKLNPEASYVYYCSNETINGVEFPYVPETGDVPLACDMSSNFLSKPIDVSKFGVIYAGAQKNIGPAGVTVVIVREDLLDYAMPVCPTVLNYKIMAAASSLHNTPPAFSIYMIGLVFAWLKELGGPAAIEQRNIQKAKAVYEVMAGSNGFYVPYVVPEFQSRMNVTFQLRSSEGDADLEKKFVADAAAQGMISLKGHRSLGGIRISLYNAITMEETLQIVQFMKDFQAANQ